MSIVILMLPSPPAGISGFTGSSVHPQLSCSACVQERLTRAVKMRFVPATETEQPGTSGNRCKLFQLFSAPCVYLKAFPTVSDQTGAESLPSVTLSCFYRGFVLNT